MKTVDDVYREIGELAARCLLTAGGAAIGVKEVDEAICRDTMQELAALKRQIARVRWEIGFWGGSTAADIYKKKIENALDLSKSSQHDEE